ncbi:hypothetical protein AB0L85_08225 [Streptomyces sp. NPDC052051]|uniref:hypothetical protein n=1 Tax=Streptomyces sp. NPDC052051 TaxID=3154649 RepID=UPI003412BCCA
MGTKTVDEADAATGAEATTNDEKTAEVTETEDTAAKVTETEDTAAKAAETGDTAAKVAEETPGEGPTGVGQGAGAVVSAGLAVVSLTGSWVSTVASARETLLGQLKTSTSASVGQQIKAVYGEAWHATALWGGAFALAALIVGVAVLARPAFGAPGKAQAPWIKSVAWGGVSLGVIGLLLAVLKYTDILLGLPSA